MKADWEKFGRCIMERFCEGDTELCMFDVQQWAEEHGVLEPVEGGFDPEVHIDLTGCCEPGDPFFMVAK